MSDAALPLPGGSGPHRALPPQDAARPAPVARDRRAVARRAADPPVWWEQMPAFWRVTAQLGAVGVIFLAFWIMFQTNNALLKDTLDEQRRQAAEDRQLFREAVGALTGEMRGLNSEVRSLTNENRALTGEVRASRVRIEAATTPPE